MTGVYFYCDMDDLVDNVDRFFRAAKKPGAKLYTFDAGGGTLVVVAINASTAQRLYEREFGDDEDEP